MSLDARRLDRIIAGLPGLSGQAADVTADQVVELARQLAPVDEGDFRDSIEKADGADAQSRRVISDGQQAPHNVYVELGSDNPNYPAQPTLAPAAAAIDHAVNVAAALKKLIGG